MSFLEKIRKKPKKTKKIILFSVLIFVLLLLIIGFFLNLKYSFSRINFTNPFEINFSQDYKREIEEKFLKLKEDINKMKKSLPTESPAQTSTEAPTQNSFSTENLKESPSK